MIDIPKYKVPGIIKSGFYQGKRIRVKSKHEPLTDNIYEFLEENKHGYIYLYAGSGVKGR